MKIPKKILKYCGQGENPDLSILVSDYDKSLDQSFGINYNQSESDINHHDELSYQNHLSEALLTSYLDYHQIFLDLPAGSTILDLGAGYCRGSLLAQAAGYPIRCLSIEKIESRVRPAFDFLNRKSLDGKTILCSDVMAENFHYPKCDAIFIYLPAGMLLNSFFQAILNQKLEGILIYVIESHGDLIQTFDFFPEIFEKILFEKKTSIQRHDPNIYKFKVRALKDVIGLYKKLNSAQECSLKNFPLWHLKHVGDDNFINIQSKVPGGLPDIKWSANIKESRLIRYNGKMALELKESGRIIQLEDQDKIVPN